MKTYKVKKMSNTRYFLEFKEKNKNGERLVVEVTQCICNNKSSNSLPNLWVKNGYTRHLYNTFLSVCTYCYLENGTCVQKYNPICKFSDDKKRMTINFDNLLEISKKNEKILIDKIYNLFMGSVEV